MSVTSQSQSPSRPEVSSVKVRVLVTSVKVRVLVNQKCHSSKSQAFDNGIKKTSPSPFADISKRNSKRVIRATCHSLDKSHEFKDNNNENKSLTD